MGLRVARFWMFVVCRHLRIKLFSSNSLDSSALDEAYSSNVRASGTLKGSLVVLIFGPRQANLVLIAYASSEGSGEPAHPRSLARTFAARSYKQ